MDTNKIVRFISTEIDNKDNKKAVTNVTALFMYEIN